MDVILNGIWARSRRLIIGAALLALAFNLQACGRFGAASSSSEDSGGTHMTGGHSSTGRPSTTASDDGEIPALKLELPADKNGNWEFADAIESITVERTLASGADQATPMQSRINAFKVTIKRKPTDEDSQPDPVVFKAEIPDSGSVDNLSPQNASQPYRLALVCRDSNCDTIVGHLKSSVPSQLAQVGFVYRLRNAQIQWLGPFSSLAGVGNSPLRNVVQSMVGVAEAPFETLEIAWGPSRFSIDLPKASMCVNGELIDTGDGDDEPLNIACTSSTTALTAGLIGNNDRGDLMIRFNDASSWALLKITSSIPSSTPNPTPTSTPVSDDPKKTFIPYDYGNPITKAWDSDRDNPEIVHRIDMWAHGTSQSNSMPQRVLAFLTNVRPSLPTLVNPLKDKGLPAELIFITFIESHYFTSPGYPIEVSYNSDGPLAVGPWQFMADTAADLGLSVRTPTVIKVKNKVRGYKSDPCDERNDLALSSRAAAAFLKDLFAQFKSDPKLAFAGYNWSPPKTQHAFQCAKDSACMKARLKKRNELNRLQELTNASVDFWMMRSFKMLPDESIEYIINFEALQFIGRDPGAYGFKLPDPSSVKIPPPPHYSCR